EILAEILDSMRFFTTRSAGLELTRMRRESAVSVQGPPEHGPPIVPVNVLVIVPFVPPSIVINLWLMAIAPKPEKPGELRTAFGSNRITTGFPLAPLPCVVKRVVPAAAVIVPQR